MTNSVSDSLWLKVISSVVLLIVGTTSAVVLERMGGLEENLGQLSGAVNRVEELDHLSERVTVLELSRKIITHAQLSSAVNQMPGLYGLPMQMELVDSLSGIEFDPRRSTTEIKITEEGSYLFVIAPQVRRVKGNRAGACVDVWLRVNGKDLLNSAVQECWSNDTDWEVTGVLILQAILTMKKSDIIEIMLRSEPGKKSGAVAIKPKDIPLIPSVIVSIIKVG